ncbi:Dyp-type peroxidase [Pedobacter sp. PAMC26386]|nr:Dyp-type peroxidase [Pedobacter sp. PAMC26386]
MDTTSPVPENNIELKNYTALSRETGPVNIDAPLEPVLDISDIQGNALPGFNKPHQYVLCFKMHDTLSGKKFLKEILPHISTLEEVLAFRRLYRARKKRLGYKPKDELGATWLNISFSYECTKRLTPSAAAFKSEAFKVGLAERSSSLGDPTSPDNEGSPHNWILGGKDNVPDVFIIIGGDRQEQLQEKVVFVKEIATAFKLECIYDEEMNTIESDGVTGLEHFGFKDGISQPGVRGRLSDMPGDYLQERYIAENVLPDSLLYGYPGQFLSWPGEFIFGYPGQTLDPLIPGSISTEGPIWTKNGSFMVFRRYKQDVKMFWKYMLDTSDELSKQGKFTDMSPQKLAAMLIGRWPGGAPYARVQDKDDKALGADKMANNYFRYASDSCPVNMVNGYQDNYPQSKADPIGLTCPMSGHIRKVNTRDTSNDAGGTLASFQQRLLRRGLPYGPPLFNPLDPNTPDPAKGNRGLIFLSYQVSIENQFEFLRNRWMSNRFSPRNPGGDDIAIGLNGNYDQDRVRAGMVFDEEAQPVNLSTSDQWITPTGGGYFFSPSLSAITHVLSESNNV